LIILLKTEEFLIFGVVPSSLSFLAEILKILAAVFSVRKSPVLMVNTELIFSKVQA
jgi:hypothetical protein